MSAEGSSLGIREPLVLASASPTRARLLAAAGIPAVADPASFDEEEIKASFRAAGMDAARCAEALAESKAIRVSERHRDALVIGADQMLECAGAWFDKPGTHDQARAQLKALRGKRHSLIAAAAVARNGAVIWRATDRASLTMRRFADSFLDAYLAAAGDDVLGSVGAYRLEGLGAQLFARVDGDFFTILGLPLLPLLEFLRGHGALDS
jgi:nucleoside triphosphate pyrophosphatase